MIKATAKALARKASEKYLYSLAVASVAYYSAVQFAAAQTADPKAPLEFQKQAQSAAQNSRINPDDAKSGLENVAGVALYGASAFSLLFAGYSLYKWWDAVNNEQSRNNAGRSAMAAVIAGIIGITGIFVGWVQNIALGGGS